MQNIISEMHNFSVRTMARVGLRDGGRQPWEFGGKTWISMANLAIDFSLLSDMQPFSKELDEKPRDTSLTGTDTPGPSPDLATSTLTRSADPTASASAPTAKGVQVTQPAGVTVGI